MKVELIEVCGFASAFKALRLPFKGGQNSDSSIRVNMNKHYLKDNNVHTVSDVSIGPKDYKLITTLIKNGDEHAKVVRGITLGCTITAPRYWWQEMDTYRIGHERLSSESTMHSEAHGLSGKELQDFKSNIKEGLEQTRIDMFSYQTLRRIYFQRRLHRLPEWKEFCSWIENLPLSELITIIRNK